MSDHDGLERVITIVWNQRSRSSGISDHDRLERALYVFRGRSGSLVKILWHDGIGMQTWRPRSAG